jgi:uncharacterized protein (DUF58 family)
MSSPALDIPRVEALLRRIRALELRVNRLLDTGLAGAYRSLFRGRGLEADGLREYTFEDDAALIDWPVSARTDRPHLRVYREERDLVCLLLVDISASMCCPTPGGTARSAATDLAALLALAALHNRDRVGLLLFATETEFWLPPTRSRAQALRLLREVAYREPVTRGTDIGEALSLAGRLAPQRSLIFLISDMAATVTATAVAALTRRHELVVLRLAPRPADELPRAGAVWVQDAETGECLPVSPTAATLAEYRDARRRIAAAAQDAVRSGGGEWVDIPNGDDAITVLARFLSRRARRARPAGGMGVPA